MEGSTLTRTLAVRRSLAAALVLPLAAAALTACNDDDSSSSSSGSSSAPSPSEATSSDSGSPSTDAGGSVEPAAFVDRLEAGIERSTTAHVSMSLDTGAMGTMTGKGDLDYSTSSSPGVAMTLSSDALGGDMDVRLVDQVMYISIPKMTHDKVVKVDLDDPSNPLGAGLGGLDPLSSLTALEKGTKSVTYVGQEEVDGRQLDHYQLRVDTAELLKSTGQKVPQGGGFPDTVDYQIWLDDQQRVAKVVMDLGDQGSLEMSVTDWGTDVDIEAPPADQVVEMPGTRLAG
jgi:hypothetical protein